MNELTPERRAEYEAELNRIYDELALVALKQQALNRQRDALEADRNVVLIELGRIGINRWDVA